VAAGARSLEGMLPNTDRAGQLVSLTVNGAPVAYRSEIIKGTKYAIFSAANANYVATYNPSGNQLPTVSITSPANGANFTAPASITIQANASDADGTITKVDFFQGSTLLNTDTGAPYSYTWNNVAAGNYTLTARATDNAGGSTTSGPVSVTVNGPCPCSVFKATDAPSPPLLDDGPAVQLGMKFRASVNGTVTGVRFYKQAGDTGPHIGQLYSRTGTMLAQATFVNESSSGWQQVNFASPVAITANTTYLISYHSGSGQYSADDHGFAQPIVNGRLTGLQKGTDGANGVYLYTNVPAFATSNYAESNYFVDLVFITSAGASATATRLEVASPKAEPLLPAQQEEVAVYPNPFSGRATVRFVVVQGGAYTLGLYDVQGRQVAVLQQGQAKAGELNSIEVDGSKLAKGMYLVRLQTSTGARAAKLLLSR
jgi:hypothetical protein